MTSDDASGGTGWSQWQVRVRGVMGPTGARALRDYRVTQQDDVTLLEGPLRPGHGLVSLLLKLQSLGLEVIDIRRSRD